MFKKIKIALATAALALGGGISGTTYASLDISDTPMFVAVNIAPNIMFVIDDSGSMFWSYMPDSIFWDRNRDRAKSSTFNRVYYDPDIEYSLPVDHKGDPLPEPDFNEAWTDGYAHYRGDPTSTVDLSSDFRPTWYYDWSSYFYAGPEEPAYYFEYDPACGNTENDSCYDKVLVDVSEQQNFVNWYSYYRSRIFASRAAIGRAFADLPDGFRLGWGRINKQWWEVIDGGWTRAVQQGVRQMDVDQRESFYEWLYSTEAVGGTPLRRALDGAGRYFDTDDVRGPWSSTPGEEGGDDLECRQSFTILMSDGFWNGGNPGVGNADGSGSTSHTGPEGLSGGYTPSDPFQDGQGNTLADVAMHYWKRDLHSTANRVPSSERDPAFWQHMVTYTIGLGVEGSIDPDDAFEAVQTSDSVDWPTVWADAGGPNIDDMLHAAVNSRGDFFSAQNPDEFSEELASVLEDIIARTSATTGVSVSATRLSTESFVYAAEFDSDDWTGELTALNAIEGTVERRASEELNEIGHEARKIFTFAPGATAGAGNGIEFRPTSITPITERFDLEGNVPDNELWTVENLVRYLRGDESHESETGFRIRSGLLGDIVNSRPLFSGAGNEGWGHVDEDYLDYVSAEKNDPRDCPEEGSCDYAREDTVFVGANDGMLHAFDARTLEEYFAYVPASVHRNLWHLADQDYNHKFYVDGQVAVGDAKLGSSWGTYLVGTLGAGGRGVYALDVTDPKNFSSDDILWELTAEDDPDIGFTYGEPLITRLGDGSGTWVAIFGNGYNSQDDQGHLFVVDLADGDILQKIAVGDAGSNGLSGVAGWRDPTQGTHVRRVYAGDLGGTMWRFDFEDGTGTLAFEDGLFEGSRAITSSPVLGAHPSGGLMVFYGTGKLIEGADKTDASLERFYGLRDRNEPIPEDTLTGVSMEAIAESGSGDEPPRRSLESDATAVGGWYVNLRVGEPKGEKILTKPQLGFAGRVNFSTFEPVEDPCTPGGIQRTYLLNALSGSGASLQIGSGAPISPPIAIKPPSAGAPSSPDIPFPGKVGEDPSFPPPPSPTGGDPKGWCSEIGIPPLYAGGDFISLGQICEGRQVWREIQ